MMVDSLAKDNAGFNIGVPGMGSIGANWADNSLTCDSAGNCMLEDSLKKGRAWRKFTRVVKNTAKVVPFVGLDADDNALRCDSAGNCMLQDSL